MLEELLASMIFNRVHQFMKRHEQTCYFLWDLYSICSRNVLLVQLLLPQAFCVHSSETAILGCFVVPANCCWRCQRLNHLLASSGTLLHQTFLAIEQPQEASLVTVSQYGISIQTKRCILESIITCFILSTIHSAESWKVTPYLLPYTFHNGIEKKYLQCMVCLKNGLISSNNFPVSETPCVFTQKSCGTTLRQLSMMTRTLPPSIPGIRYSYP